MSLVGLGCVKRSRSGLCQLPSVADMPGGMSLFERSASNRPMQMQQIALLARAPHRMVSRSRAAE
jgi:hypothetical protein